MFLRLMNPLLIFLPGYSIWVTSRIHVYFRFKRISEVLMKRRNLLLNFQNFFSIHVFEVKEFISDIPTGLPCLCDLKNQSQLPVYEVMMILSYNSLKFLQYSCFWGRWIHCWYSYLFRWPRKSKSFSVSKGSQRYCWLCLKDFRNIFNIYVFKARDSFSDIYTMLGDLKNLKQLPVLKAFEVTYTK